MYGQLKKLICSLIVLATVAVIFPFQVFAALDGITAGAFVLMDAETGQVLIEKNMNQKLYPASITKIMTILLAVENANPETVVTVSSEATILDKKEYSDSMHIALTSGENIRMEDLMYATMIESANDAANCIAESIAGSNEAFAVMMNERAVQLGAINTNFTNPHGLPDDNHVTTAYDMAQITRYAITNEKFLKIFSTVIYDIPPDNKKTEVLTISNRFSMLKPSDPTYYEGIVGGKTGYTVPAGYTGVAVATRGDKTLVAVVMGSTSGANRFADLKKILDYGFDNFVKTTITTTDVKPTVSQVVENDKIVATVAISPAADMYYLRHSSVQASDVTFNTDIKDSYSWYDIDPTVSISVPENEYMYSEIGSFDLEHTEKQLTNPIPVQGQTTSSDAADKKDESKTDTEKEKEPMSVGLKVFLIILAIILIVVGGAVILFFVSNARRRKRDKLRRLRRQEMYEKSRRESIQAREKLSK